MTGEITLVAAVGTNGVIGVDGDVPWHLPEDLRRAKALTMGHPLVLGRRTYEAIGRPLPGRTSVVVTRDPDWAPAPEHMGQVVITHSVPAALRRAASLPGGDDVMVFGGGEIYAAAMAAATRLEITWVEAAPEGDTRFPTIDPDQWAETGRQDRDGFAFVTYRRRPGGAGGG